MTPDSPDASVSGPPEQGDWWIPAHAGPGEPETPEAANRDAGSGEAGSGEAVVGSASPALAAGGTSAGAGSQQLVLRAAVAAKVGLLVAACAVVAGAFAVAAHQSDAPTQAGVLGVAGSTPSRTPSPSPLGSPPAGPDRFDPWSQPLLKPSAPPPATPLRSPVLAVARPAAPSAVRWSPPAAITAHAGVPVRSTAAAGTVRRSHRASGAPVAAVNPAPARKPTKCRGAAPTCAVPGPVAHWMHPPHPLWPPHPSSHGPQAWQPPGQAKKPGFGPPHPHPVAPHSVPPHPKAVPGWVVRLFTHGVAQGRPPGAHQG